MIKILAQTVSKQQEVTIENYPDTCPHCHYAITPQYHIATLDKSGLYLSFFCVRNSCHRFFTYQYKFLEWDGVFRLSKPIFGDPKGVEFSDTIKAISANFAYIYHQAEQAEQIGLNDICGVGYRKALEFLIKDYIIQTNPDLKPIVENKLLAACIGDHIDNKKIVDISKRAVWIGNDETHYVRKWEGMDITHLKQLIALTVHWIETEYLTNQMISAMPDPKKK